MMETLVPISAGFTTGLLSSEHIYRQSKKFPFSSIKLGFLIRVSFVALVSLWVISNYGREGFLYFILSFMAGRFFHVTYVAFKERR